MQEVVLYQDHFVSITNARIIVGPTTYSLRNVSSVRVLSTPADLGGVYIVILGSFICALMAFIDVASLWFLFLIPFAGIWLAITLKKQSKPNHFLVLATNSGEVKAISSQDFSHMSMLATKINEAIVLSNNHP